VVSNAAVRLVCTLADAAGHDKPQHPETANRVVALREAIAQQCLESNVPLYIQPTPVLEASDIDHLQQVLQLVHPASYLARLQEICSSLQAPAMIDDSTYIAPGSFHACCEVS
jgi:acetoin utilization deacetylase AcuC-like enzyme